MNKYKLPFIATEFPDEKHPGLIETYDTFKEFEASVEPYDVDEGLFCITGH